MSFGRLGVTVRNSQSVSDGSAGVLDSSVAAVRPLQHLEQLGSRRSHCTIVHKDQLDILSLFNSESVTVSSQISFDSSDQTTLSDISCSTLPHKTHLTFSKLNSHYIFSGVTRGDLFTIDHGIEISTNDHGMVLSHESLMRRCGLVDMVNIHALAVLRPD